MSDSTFDEAIRACDALQPGQAYELATTVDPHPLLARLQHERPRQFDWSVLEAGPARHRVAITRRPADGARTVSDYLGWDHARLDVILNDVSRLVGQKAYVDASRAFAEFACGLNWHIEAEETTLFPAFEEKTGIVQGPTVVLREEHRVIQRCIVEVTSALATSDAGTIERAISDLRETLGDHNIKEEQVLYPMTDRVMTDAQERDALVNRIEST